MKRVGANLLLHSECSVFSSVLGPKRNLFRDTETLFLAMVVILYACYDFCWCGGATNSNHLLRRKNDGTRKHKIAGYG